MDYSHTYVVKTKDREGRGDSTTKEALFQCGDNCHSGEIELRLQHAFGDATVKDIPALVPIVQRQQNDLSYLCDASDLPPSSSFRSPMTAMKKARDFIVGEVTSGSITSQLRKLRWIDDVDSQSYFELIGDVSSLFVDVLFIASRVYSKGLVFVMIYFEGVIYFILEDATSSENPLLDIQFPDVSSSGRGSTLAIYDGKGQNAPWMKLSVWQSNLVERKAKRIALVEPPTKDLSSDCYVQSYCILKSEGEADKRDVMFRFGSWCYSGSVELPPKISLEDIPYVIPALRVQQSDLEFVSDVTSLPSSNAFASAMEYAAKIQPSMECLAMESEGYLRNLITSVSNEESSHEGGLHWLEEDSGDSFFEFACSNHGASLADVELFAMKSYSPGGVVSVFMFYGSNWYLTLSEGDNDDMPLLDSKFPGLSTKGQGYMIQCTPAGINGWPGLRRVSIWRGSDSDAALEGSLKSEEWGNMLSNFDERTTVNRSAVVETESSETKQHQLPVVGDENSAGDDAGDIYAQLDKLDRRLDRELSGLSKLL
ncbi:hypothetical protein ACHAWF_017861 [Thalassiosira exigua]